MNIAIIKGNITREIEVKYLTSGTPVAEFSLAINEVWYNDAKEKQERTHFIGCVAWGTTAENIAKYFDKGSPILIEGSLTQETWEDKESGKKREKTKVKVSRWDFCGGDRKTGEHRQTGEASRNAPAERMKPKPDPDLDPADDDIPF